MKNFSRIMVALDLSMMDEHLMSYSLWFAKSTRAEKIYFIYCARELREVQEYIVEDKETLPRDEKLRQHFAEAIAKHDLPKGLEHEVIVDQSMPLEGLLYWKDVKKTDLLMVGKKRSSSGSGVVSKQFVRQSDCPVLFVPEDAEKAMENILVPVDFSQNSGYALQAGIDLRPYFGSPGLICMNVFFAAPEVYSGHETGLYASLRKKVAVDKFVHFIAPFSGAKEVDPLFIADNNFNIIERINETAKAKKAGLVIIGAIGHSKVKLLTVGSTAEKLMMSDCTVPLLVIKR